MKLNTILLAVVAVVVTAAIVAAAEPNVGALTKELNSPNPAQRSAQEWEAAYSAVLDAIMADLGNDDAGRRASAQSTLERIAFNASRPGAEDQRAACAKAIAAKLGTDIPALAKIWLIRQLERIGRAEAVEQLGKCLADGDAQVRESARRALIKNPAREAGEPLRKAMASADPAWRIALINAIGMRQDSADAGLLIKEAASENEDVRIAAMRALAKLGDKSAAATLGAAMQKGSDRTRQVATDSYLLLADALAGKGDNAAALEMYRGMVSAQGYLKCAGIVGLGRAGGVAELPTIFTAAADSDPKVRGAAVEAMSLMKGDGVTAAIAARVGSADPLAKVALLQALQRRGDKSAAATIITAADDADESVRIEAARGLGTLGDARCVALLLKLAASGGNVQPVARWSVHVLKGDAVNNALAGEIEDKDAKVRIEAIRAMALRHVVGAAPAFLKAAEDADSGVRVEAIRAIGIIGPSETLAPVTALLLKTDDNATRDEAAKSIATIAGRDADADKATAPIIAALNASAGPAKLALISVLGRLGGGRSLDAVRAAAKDNDAAVKNAAIRAMADWPDASAAADLVEIAKAASDQTYQVLALRGCVRMLRDDRDMQAAAKAKLLAAALEVAKRPDEKRQAIGALAEVRHLDAMQAVVSCLGDAALAQEAANAAVRIGRDIVNNNAQAVKAAMQKVLETTKNADTQKQAQETMDRAERRLKEKP